MYFPLFSVSQSGGARGWNWLGSPKGPYIHHDWYSQDPSWRETAGSLQYWEALYGSPEEPLGASGMEWSLERDVSDISLGQPCSSLNASLQIASRLSLLSDICGVYHPARGEIKQAQSPPLPVLWCASCRKSMVNLTAYLFIWLLLVLKSGSSWLWQTARTWGLLCLMTESSGEWLVSVLRALGLPTWNYHGRFSARCSFLLGPPFVQDEPGGLLPQLSRTECLPQCEQPSFWPQGAGISGWMLDCGWWSPDEPIRRLL